MKIQDTMTTKLVTTTPDASLKDAARAMAENHISGLPVVDAEGLVIGVLSEADIIAKEVDDTPRGSVLQRFLEGPPVDDRFYARTVGDAMSSPALTITGDRPVAQAASTMLAEGINRLPVVDAKGLLVGLVTRGDLVRAFTRDDNAIFREIMQLIRDLWLDATPLELNVDDGFVTIRGEVENEADARVLRTLIRRIPGVIDVDAKLLVPHA